MRHGFLGLAAGSLAESRTGGASSIANTVVYTGNVGQAAGFGAGAIDDGLGIGRNCDNGHSNAVILVEDEL
jgi:hypothetical protein